MAAPGRAVRIRSVNPTGTVDLMTRVASGAAAIAWSSTVSTDLVSKKLVWVS